MPQKSPIDATEWPRAASDEIARYRQRNERLVQELRIQDMALSNTADFNYVFDLAGRFVYINRALLDLWGKSASEAVGKNFFDLDYPPALASRLQEQIREVIETKRPLRDETPYTSAAGTRGYEYIFVPVLDAQGNVEMVAGSTRDITDRKVVEEKLRDAHEALVRQAAELRDANLRKDQFLAALSHELRTPLTPVLMTATALESDPSLAVDIRAQLGMMRRNIELEARLIDDLLDLTRIRHGKLQFAPIVTNLHELLHHTAEIVRSDELGKQVQILFHLEASRHHCLGDPTRLQQVFWNLIKNALKFTPSGGSITITTHNDDEGWIVLTVADTGIGISAETLPHVFTAFEQGDAAGQHRFGGLGLGLAIANGIVDAHGGTIRAASEGVGRGATFTVALATTNAIKPENLEAGAQQVSHTALRLLVVEDHEATRTVLTRLLTRDGYQVTAVACVQDALAAFAGDRFDVVISDLGLPDGSGLELMRELQKEKPVSGIALSGYGMEDDLRRTKEAGFFAHLVKPVNLDELRRLLRELPVV